MPTSEDEPVTRGGVVEKKAEKHGALCIRNEKETATTDRNRRRSQYCGERFKKGKKRRGVCAEGLGRELGETHSYKKKGVRGMTGKQNRRKWQVQTRSKKRGKKPPNESQGTRR